jgi:hypothetical protein
MKKNLFILLFLLVFLSFSALSCKKVEKKPIVDTVIHEIGKSITLENHSEVTLQDVQAISEFKLQTTTDGVQSFPYVYLKKEKSGPRIIRIEKDGSTIDTLIDTVNSKSYASAYMVEAGGDLTKTIARYVLDTKKDVVKPKSPKDKLIFVSIMYKNVSRKTILSKDFVLYFEAPEKNQIQFDTILAETILSSSLPKEIKSGETVSLRYVGVLPDGSKEVMISFEGKKFKWENKETKPAK